jgi:hypothetical protein
VSGFEKRVHFVQNVNFWHFSSWHHTKTTRVLGFWLGLIRPSTKTNPTLESLVQSTERLKWGTKKANFDRDRVTCSPRPYRMWAGRKIHSKCSLMIEERLLQVSLASHTLQSQEKEGLVTMRTVSCSGGMQKTSRVTANNAGSIVCAQAASKALLSNKFKSRNLIGRAWFTVV